MKINNPWKLVGIILAMISLSALRWHSALSEASFNLQFGVCVGYLVGNGIAARAGVPVHPVITKRAPAEGGDD